MSWQRVSSMVPARSLSAFAALILAVVLLGPNVAAAEEMSFNLLPFGDLGKCRMACPMVIVAEGEITDRTPDQFVDFVRQNRSRTGLRAVVFLHSQGGKVLASMQFGRVMRKLGIAAVVARARLDASGGAHVLGGRCFSACVYALMGGQKRVIPPESEVGIHRMFIYEYVSDPASPMGERRRRYDDGGMAAALVRYSGMMGISPGLVNEAEHISSDSIHIVTRAEMARWRLGSSRL